MELKRERLERKNRKVSENIKILGRKQEIKGKQGS